MFISLCREVFLLSVPDKKKIHHVFNEIAPTYDLVNSILSMGIDKHWRHQVIHKVPQNTPLSILDIATGTGEQILSILQAREQVVAVGIDTATHMLEKARSKAQAARLHNRIAFEEADALDLPFANHSFDMVTISFGIRNVASLQECFKEIYRVLKPGGTLLILEFSLPTNFWVKKGYLFYLRHLLPGIGKLISKHPTAYTYLNQTIEAFPYGKELCQLLEKEGFTATYQPYTLGIASLYTATTSH